VWHEQVGKSTGVRQCRWQCRSRLRAPPVLEASVASVAVVTKAHTATGVVLERSYSTWYKCSTRRCGSRQSGHTHPPAPTRCVQPASLRDTCVRPRAVSMQRRGWFVQPMLPRTRGVALSNPPSAKHRRLTAEAKPHRRHRFGFAPVTGRNAPGFGLLDTRKRWRRLVCADRARREPRRKGVTTARGFWRARLAPCARGRGQAARMDRLQMSGGRRGWSVQRCGLGCVFERDFLRDELDERVCGAPLHPAVQRAPRENLLGLLVGSMGDSARLSARCGPYDGSELSGGSRDGFTLCCVV